MVPATYLTRQAHRSLMKRAAALGAYLRIRRDMRQVVAAWGAQ